MRAVGLSRQCASWGHLEQSISPPPAGMQTAGAGGLNRFPPLNSILQRVRQGDAFSLSELVRQGFGHS